MLRQIDSAGFRFVLASRSLFWQDYRPMPQCSKVHLCITLVSEISLFQVGTFVLMLGFHSLLVHELVRVYEDVSVTEDARWT